MSARNGGPAFPTLARMGVDEESGNKFHEYVDEGMTLRDYFAAKAMLVIMPDARCLSYEHAAEQSYKMADAMLKARETTE